MGEIFYFKAINRIGSLVKRPAIQSLLALTRKTTEVIRVGNDVQVMVLAIKGNEVRLGIVAPLDVVVDRAEVAERKRRERDELAR